MEKIIIFENLCTNKNSRAAVMRGQVVTEQGLGIIDFRVSVDKEDTKFGFTLTRAGGW